MFEIYYSDGGHCGPFNSLAEAIDGAKRRIKGKYDVWDRTIEIRQRAVDMNVGGYNEKGFVVFYDQKSGQFYMRLP